MQGTTGAVMVEKMVGEDGEKYMPELVMSEGMIRFYVGKGGRKNFIQGFIQGKKSLMVCQADFVVSFFICLMAWNKEFFQKLREGMTISASREFDEWLRALQRVSLAGPKGAMFNSEVLYISIEEDSTFVRDHGSWKEVLIPVETVSLAILRLMREGLTEIQVNRNEFTLEFQVGFVTLLSKVQHTLSEMGLK